MSMRACSPSISRGKRALVAGVADDGGFGFAIAKALAEAGATVCVGTWPPALGIFKTMLERGKFDESLQLAGRQQARVRADLSARRRLRRRRRRPRRAARVQALPRPRRLHASTGCAARCAPTSASPPRHRRAQPRQRPRGEEAAARDLAQGLPRRGRRHRAYSFVSMVQRLGPLMRPGGSFLSLTYMASERVVPGYGGGMSSAKAALEIATRACSRSRPAASGAIAST